MSCVFGFPLPYQTNSHHRYSCCRWLCYTCDQTIWIFFFFLIMSVILFDIQRSFSKIVHFDVIYVRNSHKIPEANSFFSCFLASNSNIFPAYMSIGIDWLSMIFHFHIFFIHVYRKLKKLKLSFLLHQVSLAWLYFPYHWYLHFLDGQLH